MKKYFSLALVLLLVFSIATSTAFAADVDDSNTRAACQHNSGTYTTTTTSYYGLNATQHDALLHVFYWCNSCDAQLPDYGYTVSLGPSTHTFVGHTVLSSNHSGKYTTHQYTYSQHCDKCYYSITRTASTGCTATQCYYPA